MPWWPTEPSSVATRAPCSRSARRREGRRESPPARSRRWRPRPPACPAGSPAARCPTPPPTRIARWRGLGAREAVAERPQSPQLRRPLAARTAAACRGRRPRAGSGTRRCGAWRSRTPAAGRGRSSSPPPQRSAAASMANCPGLGSVSRRRPRAARDRRRVDRSRARSTAGGRTAPARRPTRSTGPLHAARTPSARCAVQLLQAQHLGLASVQRHWRSRARPTRRRRAW